MGLASCLAVVTLGLAVTGRIGLYINPNSAWFAIGMAVLTLVGAALSFLLPLGAEDDHGHDHGDHGHHEHQDHAPGEPVGRAIVFAGGAAASVIVVGMLVMPPASLSAQLAASRDVGAPPLFAGSDTLSLATTGDTASFGVGDWASVFATATNPDAFEGDAVTLVGFVSGDTSGGFGLTRLVITHCVIDAQTATVPVSSTAGAPPAGQWVSITGTVRSSSAGKLQIVASQVTAIPEPSDPYEY
ncbi:TIGR03943 family protein [Microbacterium sp. SORGH_AS_0888]|uniref:TIGR03943 family putative permease subunit n=1 Tax=Microbacterium sp. SORGH_AS_0888 TaxID=3041791 RepID=UPI0027D8999C|nr:TIGR03943 family protein [Microbacterium sp. SORGH_AS_0888]